MSCATAIWSAVSPTRALSAATLGPALGAARALSAVMLGLSGVAFGSYINARYDFFEFLTSDGIVRLGECFLSRGHHECIQEILGYFLSILGGRRVSGWH